MWSRAVLKNKAKAALKGSYWKAFLISLVIAFVGGNNNGGFSFNLGGGNGGNGNSFGVPSQMDSKALALILIILIAVIIVIILALAFRIFLGYPLEVGGRKYFVEAAQGNVDMNALGFAFKKPLYFDIIKAMLWRAILNFLWYLLLIIPGIVKSFAYRMVPYILADNPNIGYKRALELSNQMTNGEKFKIFVLDLSFIGWYLLGLMALFVGVLFVTPYYNATLAELYLTLRKKALDKGLCSYEELGLTNIVF